MFRFLGHRVWFPVYRVERLVAQPVWPPPAHGPRHQSHIKRSWPTLSAVRCHGQGSNDQIQAGIAPGLMFRFLGHRVWFPVYRVERLVAQPVWPPPAHGKPFQAELANIISREMSRSRVERPDTSRDSTGPSFAFHKGGLLYQVEGD
jgi:hypothetical protein